MITTDDQRARTVDGPMFYTAVRTPRWLYVEYHETDQAELQDLANDPYQMRNQANNPAFINKRETLAARLAELRDCAGADCRQSTLSALPLRG